MATKIAGACLLVGIILFSSGLWVWAQRYEGRIPPNVTIAGMSIGGLDPEQARQQLQDRVDTLVLQGIPLSVHGDQRVLPLSTFDETSGLDAVAFDLDTPLAQAMNIHRPQVASNTFSLFQQIFRHTALNVPVELQSEQIKSAIFFLYPDAEQLSQNAQFVITPLGATWNIDVVPGTAGKEFQWTPFFDQLHWRLTQLDNHLVELDLIDQEPRVSVASAESQKPLALISLQSAPYPVTYTQDARSWNLTAVELQQFLQPGSDNKLTLLDEPFDAWIQKITQDVNRPAQNARLNIQNGRVIDFIQSKEGQKIDELLLKEHLLSAIQSGSSQPYELVVAIDEPTLKTGDVNDLGISQLLGSGTSSYRGSPRNRQGNIQNGVDLLNGRLIAPGETFSLIEALSPFTYDNGYLPELVIKGDKIEPEMGGGLCQIGTTTFRVVMNSGLNVIERRNHSLVVSYYNDQSNGNPGTDATIYEPAPDFKFQNNTGHTILFQAENLTDTQELRFSFWGTSDGRKGSYTPPVVLRWIPVGEEQRVETTNLEPGVEQCQSAHIGADTSFVYSVIDSQGEITKTTFESHYRPLPRMCLVGVEELSSEEVVLDPELPALEIDQVTNETVQ